MGIIEQCKWIYLSEYIHFWNTFDSINVLSIRFYTQVVIFYDWSSDGLSHLKLTGRNRVA